MYTMGEKMSLDISQFENQCCECGAEYTHSAWMWYGPNDGSLRKSLMHCNDCWTKMPLEEKMHGDRLALWHEKYKEWSKK